MLYRSSKQDSEGKIRGGRLLFGAVGGLVLAVGLCVTARLLQLAGDPHLLSSLPRNCLVYDNTGTRIQLTLRKTVPSDEMVLRRFVGIERSPQIESASLSGSSGRAALKVLTQVEGLKRLSMLHVPIDESVIADLEKLKCLTKLQLVSCTICDIRMLRHRLPRCTVYTESNPPPWTDEQRRLFELAFSAADPPFKASSQASSEAPSSPPP